ncbi:MAG: hypothetical protein M3154_08305 [Candidatus Eremiobacteraeota bacterium]|nr:hypothetical protein [Candidatus Eremiobacteraeota bacterium]
MRVRFFCYVPAAAMLACCAGRAAVAQEPASAAAVVDSFFQALSTERWADAAQQLDLHSIEAIRSAKIMSVREATTGATKMTVQRSFQLDPEMPRAVAAYLAKRAIQGMREYDGLDTDFARVSSPDSLERLPLAEAAARWLEAHDERYQMRRMLRISGSRDCGYSAADLAELASSIRAPRRRIIGAIVDDSVAFVLYQRRSDAAGPSQSAPERAAMLDVWYVIPPSIVSLRRIAGEWRVVPIYGGFDTGAFGLSCGPRPKPRKSK